MEWSRDRGLALRMAVTFVLLGVVTCVFLGVVYGAVVVVLLWMEFHVLLPSGSSVWFGLLVTGIVIAAIVYEEFSGDALALKFVESLPTRSASERSDSLQRTVEQLAHQADLPVPTVVIAESALPTAYTSGLTPGRTTIVVTSALLEALDAEERRAVLAHELAHVKHRDVAVMTISSVPLDIARSIKGWVESKRSNTIGQGVGYIVSVWFWVVGRLLIRLLSRYRELAADRGAVALTGSPAAVASAITKLSRQRDDTAEDLRARRTSIEAFSIVPVETPIREPVRIGPRGERLPAHHWYTYPIQKLTAPLFATHPSMDRRLDQLREIESKL